jgi:16S rRNA processing protein RimM
MEKPDCHQAGNIIKTFGYKGGLVVRLFDGFEELIQKEGFVFIETEEELVPYFLTGIEAVDDTTFRVTFDDIDDSDQARAFTSAGLWFPKSAIPESFLEDHELFDIEGYKVTDKNFGEVGIVRDVVDYPGHSVLRILRQKKEILLPLEGGFVTKVIRKSRTILIEAPEGLIESYL